MFIASKLSSAANSIKQQEEEFLLATVPYDVFWSKVKLVGYTMQLRPEHMRLIAPHINLNYEKDLLVFSRTIAKQILADEDFGYNDGLHEPQKLLLIGFLYCQFKYDAEGHKENLWHLINPNFKKTVSMRVVEQTLGDLLYLSIDQRLKIVETDEEAPPTEKSYLEQCLAAKEPFIE